MAFQDALVVFAAALKHTVPHGNCTFEFPAIECRVSVVTSTGETDLPVNSIPGSTSVVALLPPGPRPIHLRVRVAPKGALASRLFEVQGDVSYDGKGVWSGDTATDEFASLQSLDFELTGSVGFLSVLLSRLRDRTRDVLASLAAVPPGREVMRTLSWPAPPSPGAKLWPPTSWHAPQFDGISYVTSPPLLGDDLTFVDQALAPNGDNFVVEIKGFQAPKLLAVHWPDELRLEVNATEAGPFPKVEPVPILLYLHHKMGQEFPAFFSNGPHPFGFDFLLFGLFRDMFYTGNPLAQQGSKGIAYQMAASGRKMVAIVPMNKIGAKDIFELDEFLDSNLVEEILEELIVYSGVKHAFSFCRPNIGHSAMASFSSGCSALSAFLTLNAQKRFASTILKEVYYLSPHIDSVKEEAPHAGVGVRWAGADPTRRVRFYTLQNHSGLNQLVGNVPKPPFIVDSADHRFTAGSFPAESWESAVGSKPGGGSIHAMIAGTMITDALRRSGFPAR